jgi:N-acetylglucosamine-6-phosphate deacetylase
MSKNPAELIGLDAGVLAPGKLADITVVDPGLRVCAVFTEGRRSV